jgi:hypothetical protein
LQPGRERPEARADAGGQLMIDTANPRPAQRLADPPVTGFVAWQRCRSGRQTGRWTQIAHGRDESEAFRNALSAATGDVQHRDLVILEAGESP